MNYVYIGEIVNTHGIKGEVRIISDFKYKKEVFKKDFNLYIGEDKTKLVINTYRIHKNYDMVTFIGINDINDVLDYKGKKVYINRDEIEFSGILDTDIIGLEVITDKKIGVVKDIMKTKAHDILVVEENDSRYLIPYIKEFVDKIDLNNKKIYIKEIEGLIDEN